MVQIQETAFRDCARVCGSRGVQNESKCLCKNRKLLAVNSFLSRLLLQFANNSAADEPGESFDKKITREVGVLIEWPVEHGLVAGHGGECGIMEHETRRSVGEPADVFECFPNEASGFLDEAAMKRASNRMDPGEDEAFGRLRAKRREPLLINQIADEEARRLASTWRLADLRALS